MPINFRDVSLALTGRFDGKKDKNSIVRGIIVDAQGNQSGAGDIWADLSTRRVWWQEHGAAQPAQIRCVKIPNPYIGLKILVGFAEGSMEREVLSDDPFDRVTNPNGGNWTTLQQEDLQPGGRAMLWLQPKAFAPLAVWPGVGLTVNVNAGEYTLNNAVLSYAGVSNYDLSTYQPAGPSEHLLIGLYLDGAGVLGAVAGATVSTATTPPEPTWPNNIQRLATVRINDTQSEFSFANDISSKKGLYTTGGNAWPGPLEYKIGYLNYDTLQDAIDAASDYDQIAIGSGQHTLTAALTIEDKIITIVGASDGSTVLNFDGGTNIADITATVATLVRFQNIEFNTTTGDMTGGFSVDNGSEVDFVHCDVSPNGNTIDNFDIIDGYITAKDSEFSVFGTSPGETFNITVGEIYLSDCYIGTGITAAAGSAAYFTGANTFAGVFSGAGDLYGDYIDANGVITYPTETAPQDGYIPVWDSTAGVAGDWVPQPNLVGSTYYLHNDAADVVGYEQLRLEPANGTEVIETVAVTSGTSPVLIDPYISYPTSGVGVTIIPAGVWQFVIYGKVDSVATGNSQINCKVYKRTQAGTETELVTFSVTTPNLTTTVAEYTVNSVQDAIAWTSTDRLVLKFYALTSSVASRNVSLYYDGATHYTHVHLPSLGDNEALYAYPAPGEAKNGLSTYAVVQNAINASTAGDVITVGPGTFTEAITANKAIHLKGTSREKTILYYTGGSGFNITASGLILENLTIKNASAGASLSIYGLAINNNCTLRNVTIDCSGVTGTSTNSYGIGNFGAYTVTMENVTVVMTNANATNVAGYYSGNASAIANIISGSLSGTAGTNKYDILISSGTVNLQKVKLINGTVSNAGTIGGDYIYNGSLYQPGADDIYPGGDTAGIAQRFSGFSGSGPVTYNFNTITELSSNFTWDAVNFSGTPNNISIPSPSPSNLRIYDTTGTNSYFAYRTLSFSGVTVATIYSGVTITSLAANYAIAGIRFDNPSAPTTNYVNIYLLPGTGSGLMQIQVDYDIGAGLVSTNYADGIPASQYQLRLQHNSSTGNTLWYYGLLTPQSQALASVTAWTNTTIRAGLIIANIGAVGSTVRAGMFDYWTEFLT